MAKRGRKSKLTPAARKVAVEMASKGMCISHIAQAIGVGRDTFSDWLVNNSTFASEIKKAEADGIASLMDQIIKAARKNWQAAAWILERRFPQQFARVQLLDVKQRVQPGDVPNTSEADQRAAAQETWRQIFGIVGKDGQLISGAKARHEEAAETSFGK